MSTAQDILNQYMAYAMAGEPPMGEGATPLDGKRVTHQGSEDVTGTVLGPSFLEGHVWVVWDGEGGTVTGLHRLIHLKEVEDA